MWTSEAATTTTSRSFLPLSLPNLCLHILFFLSCAMAACGSLSSLFEKPMPDAAPSLLDSLSPWNQIVPKKHVENGSCFTELFGELHFQEKPSSKAAVPSPHSSPRSPCGGRYSSLGSLLGFSGDAFPLRCSDRLQLCTESLGSESSDDVDDLMQEDDGGWEAEGEEYCGGGGGRWREKRQEKVVVDGGCLRNCSDVRPRTGRFPPPISSIGRSGKPWFYFKSYREGGRFVLREIRIPTHEFLQASREDGRLKLQLVLPGEEIPEGNEEEEEAVEEEEEEREVICEDNGD